MFSEDRWSKITSEREHRWDSWVTTQLPFPRSKASLTLAAGERSFAARAHGCALDTAWPWVRLSMQRSRHHSWGDPGIPLLVHGHLHVYHPAPWQSTLGSGRAPELSLCPFIQTRSRDSSQRAQNTWQPQSPGKTCSAFDEIEQKQLYLYTIGASIW